MTVLCLQLVGCGMESGEPDSSNDHYHDASNALTDQSSTSWKEQYGSLKVGTNGTTLLMSENYGGSTFAFNDSTGNQYRLYWPQQDINNHYLEIYDNAGTQDRVLSFHVSFTGIEQNYSGRALAIHGATVSDDGSMLYVTVFDSKKQFWLAAVDMITGITLNAAFLESWNPASDDYAKSGYPTYNNLKYRDDLIFMQRYSYRHIVNVIGKETNWLRVFDSNLTALADNLPTGYSSNTLIRNFGTSGLLGNDNYDYRDGILYIISADRLRESHQLMTFELVTDPESEVTRSRFLWSQDLHDCNGCGNEEKVGPNRPGTNTDMLKHAFPGFWIDGYGNINMPSMIYRNQANPSFSVHSYNEFGNVSDSGALMLPFNQMIVSDMATNEDGSTYLVGNIEFPFTVSPSYSIDKPGFIIKQNGQAREWIKLITAQEGNVNITGVRVDSSSGISVTGTGSGIIEDVVMPQNESEFTIQYTDDLLNNYQTGPDVIDRLEMSSPPLASFLVGQSWVYRDSGTHVTQRITIKEDGTGTVRTWSSDPEAYDGIFAPFNWSIEGNVLTLDYTASTTCDFFNGVWIDSGEPSSDTPYTITMDGDGIKFSGFVHESDNGSNGSPQVGGSCTLW
jgi:hypothetical protein